MAAFKTCEGFEQDLDDLVEPCAANAGLIDALVEQLCDDSDTVASLALEIPKWLHNYTPPFEIKRFEECWSGNRRIYLLKIYDEDGHLIDHRVFIGHDIHTDEFFALSIGHRETCYDSTTDAFRDLCARYDGLRIPPIGR